MNRPSSRNLRWRTSRLPDGPLAQLAGLRARLREFNTLHLRARFGALTAIPAPGGDILLPVREIEAQTRGTVEPILSQARDTLLRRLHVQGFRELAPGRILDAGSRYGLFGLLASRLWPQADLRSFEPDRRYREGALMCAIMNGAEDRAMPGGSLHDILHLCGWEDCEFLKLDAGAGMAEWLVEAGPDLERVRNVAVRFDEAVPPMARVRVEQALSRAGHRIALAGDARAMQRAFLPQMIYAAREGDLAV